MGGVGNSKGRAIVPARRWLFLLVVLAMTLAACGSDDSTSTTAAADTTPDTSVAEGPSETTEAVDSTTTVAPAADDEPTQLTIGLPANTLGMYGFFATEALGYFEQEGLDVELVATGGGAEARQQLVAGNVDIAEIAPDAVLAVLHEVDLYPFYTYFTQSFRDIGLPVDGEIQSVEELEGRTIGVSSLSGGEVPLLRYVLREAGIDPDGVELVAVGEEPANVIAALDAGRIDALASGRSIFVALGSAGWEFNSVLPPELAEGPIEGLVARSPWNEDTETLAAVGRAVSQGVLFCQTNPEACIDAIGEARPELIEDRELASDIIDRFLGLTAPVTVDGKFEFRSPTVQDFELFADIFGDSGDEAFAQVHTVNLSDFVLDLTADFNTFDYDAVVERAESS